MSKKPEEEKKRPTVNDVGLEDLDKDEGAPNQAQEEGKENIQDPSSLAPPAEDKKQEEEKKEESKAEDEKAAEQNDENEDVNERQQEDEAAPEEEKKDGSKQNQKIAKTTNYFDEKTLVVHRRSNLLTMNDRHLLEQDILAPLEAGTGLFGLTKIDLLKRKKEICQINDQKKVPQNNQLIDCLEADGVFIDSQLMFKNKDINIQKLEERLLNNGQSEYFKLNGEIKLNNDLFADELTRPSDLAFEQTDAFQTVENNAIKTDRMNSFKQRYYRIDIIIGKIVLKTMPAQFFGKEDQLMLEIKHLCKDYDRRVSQALIPFLMERIESIEKEIKEKKNVKSNEKTKRDVPFLQKMVKNLKEELDTEKKELKQMAQEIYDKWIEITKVRTDNNQSTQYDLKVHQGENNDDVLFNLVRRANAGQFQEIAKQRQNQAEKTLACCKLIIDGSVVAETKKVPISWPSYEIDFLDQFQIHVFTLPNKVELEIIIDNTTTDIVELIIPGSHVKTLTSASRIIKEYQFSRKEFYIENKLKQGVDLLKDKKLLSEGERKKIEKEEAIMERIDTQGSVFIKAEWEGFGNQMPPARAETLLEMKQNEKNRFYYTKEEQYELLNKQKPIDVNDPRNEEIIKAIQRMKNDYMDRLLDNDAKFQLHDIKSFRHKLMESRANDPNYQQIPIPQLNHELIQDKAEYYKNWLENVMRAEAIKYKQDKELQYKVAAEKQRKNDDLSIDEQYDIATKQRRAIIQQKLKKRESQNQTGTAANRQVHYDSTVNEFQFDDEKSIFDNIKNLFKVSRKLKPTVQKRQPRTIESLGETNLLVHIIRAQDVPIRTKYYDQFLDYIEEQQDAGEAAKKNSLKKLYDQDQVKCFIEVRVVDPEIGLDMSQKTCVSEGQSPEWNEILEFTIKAKNKTNFTLEELRTSKVQIHLTLFDQEVTVDEITKMKQIVYIENRFLGSFTVPLTTILGNSKFDGTVRLNRPLVIQNYNVVQDEIMFLKDTNEIKEQQKREEEQIPTYLNLCISLEPLITIPKNNDKDYYKGKERSVFLEYGSQWMKKMFTKFKKSERIVKCFFEDIDGVSVFIPKFLTPLAPPDEIYNKDTNRKKGIEKAARFVSLIPYVDDSSVSKDMNDITFTCQEFLDWGKGDSEEHAILLCNYFNYIDMNEKRQVPLGQSFQSAERDIYSYIVYGESIPEGETWYVLRRDRINNYVEIWNPMTAECYSFDLQYDSIKGVFGLQKTQTMNQRPQDPICPMHKIWCVAGEENIWANIQSEEAPVLINFCLENTKYWMPFIDEKKKKQYTDWEVGQQIQVKSGEQLIYSKKSNNFQNLEDQIKKYIAGKFEDERIAQVKKTTNWNIQVGDDVKRILEAEQKIINDYKEDVENQFKQDQNKKSRGRDFNKKDALWEKYFVDKTYRNVLIDFEEYMMMARKGGTQSKMRMIKGRDGKLEPEEQDEDIRASIVQSFLDQISQNVKKSCWAIPINMTLTSKIEDLWEIVKSTKVHEIDNQDVEFALSVMVRPYPCNIFSVWIYLSVFKDYLDDE